MKKYTVKNIIFGLRGEYLNFYKKVQELENLVICKKPHHLYVTRNNDGAPFDVVCSFDLEEQAYKSDRKKTVAGYIYDTMEDAGERVHDNETIQIPDKKLFEQRVLALSEEPFASIPMTDVLEIKHIYNSYKDFFVWPNLMEFSHSDNHNSILNAVFYYPYEDRIYFETTAMLQKPTERMIRSVLEEEVPEHLFKVCHKEIMDKYPDREITIENTRKNNKTVGFDIVETEKGLVLKR